VQSGLSGVVNCVWWQLMQSLCCGKVGSMELPRRSWQMEQLQRPVSAACAPGVECENLA
jgi:hypothetical protein